MRSLAPATLCATLAACGPPLDTPDPPGTISGRIYLMWVDDGGSSGDGTFVFVPVPGQELTFTRNDPKATLKTITPEMMYTDGGSIPRLAQVFKGFSPWGYAPAYMVHDWLFIAKNCNTDGKAKGKELLVKDMEFQESAAVMNEAIHALVAQKMVKPADIAEALIPAVVGGPIARRLWEQDGACEARRVSEADRKAALAGIPGGARLRGTDLRTLDDGRRIPLEPGQLIATFSF